MRAEHDIEMRKGLGELLPVALSDAAADSARDAAIAELQGEAQRMVDNAVASAKAELANVKFRYEEVGVPYGFAMYWGSNGSNQTISVPANSNNTNLMKNKE